MKQLVQRDRSGKIAVCEVPAPTCADGRILVRNRASLVSLGTERSQVLAGRQGIAGKARERPGIVRRVVEKARREGLRTTLRHAAGKLDAVRQLGYSSAGVVTRVGAGVTTVSPGDRVACIGVGWATHAESVLLPPTLCSRLPAGVSFEAGSFGMLGCIALNGIRKAQVTFGETVAVVGLGLVGLLTAQLLRAYGMRVLGYDIDPRKCEIATGLGISGRSGDWDAFAAEVAAATAGHGADAVMLTVASTDAAPVDRGVRLLRHAGRAVLVGRADVHPDRQALWEREAELVVSKSGGPGCYEPDYEEHGIDHPYAWVRWTQQRNLEEFLRQLAAGGVQVGPLVTHRCGIDDAAEWYARIVDDRRALTVGAVIEYPGAPEDPGLQTSTLAAAAPRTRPPDTRPRLLLHIGLAKTATTSLQHNVLMPWHDTQRINLLGRHWEDGRFHYPFAGIFERIARRRLDAGALDALRPAAAALLHPARLNVISDERIGGMETVGDGAGIHARAVLENLGALFRDAEVTVLAALRSPADQLLASYAEGYHWRFHAVRGYDTFDRFLDQLFRHGSGDDAWLVCFQDAWLRAVAQQFERVEVLLYEDLIHDPARWFGPLAACLDADPAEIERLFVETRRNAAARTPAGRWSRPVTLYNHFVRLAPAGVRRGGKRLLQGVPPLYRLYRRAAGITLPAVEHRYAGGAVRDRVQRLVGLRDDYLTRRHGISAERLARYGFLHPDHAALAAPAVPAPAAGAAK